MKVYPTSAEALAVWHPSDPGKRLKLIPEGSDWPDDGFTFRMIAQDIATEDSARAFRPNAPAAQATAPVANAKN